MLEGEQRAAEHMLKADRFPAKLLDEFDFAAPLRGVQETDTFHCCVFDCPARPVSTAIAREWHR